MTDTLRTKLIRLAHAKPELRGTLLPLLAKTAANKKYTISKPIKWKDGSVTEAGESVEVSYKRGNHTTAFLMLDGTPKGVRITNLSMYLKGYPKMPGMAALEKMSDAAVVPTPSGYKVEPDGYGPDGSPSWMLVAGVI